MGVNVRIVLPHKDGFVWGLGHHLRRNTIIILEATNGFGGLVIIQTMHMVQKHLQCL
jgi:hypothetical protein